jgi:hypothetical protein
MNDTTKPTSKAHSPEVNARRAATRAATMAARKAGKANGHSPESNAKRAATAKATWARRKANERKRTTITSIPLDAIPDAMPKKKYARKSAPAMTFDQMATEIIRLAAMMLAKKG